MWQKRLGIHDDGHRYLWSHARRQYSSRHRKMGGQMEGLMDRQKYTTPIPVGIKRGDPMPRGSAVSMQTRGRHKAGMSEGNKWGTTV
jgi:hypothetical protein